MAPHVARRAAALGLGILAIAACLAIPGPGHAAGEARPAAAAPSPPGPASVAEASGAPAPDGPVAAAPPALRVFVRPGCPHCAAAKEFLPVLALRRPELEVRLLDVESDPANLRALADVVRRTGARAVSVPTFAIGDELLVGFEDAAATGPAIEAAIDRAWRAWAGEASPPGEGTAAEEVVEVPLLGSLDARALGLPLFTLALGLVDGFNPCAMWVLLFLLSMLVHLKDRRKMLAIAGTFVAVSGLVYFAFMAAWLNLFLLVGLSRGVEVALGLVAVAIGAVNVKDFFAFKRGVSLSIPEGAKAGIYARARAVLRAEHLGGSMAAVAVLAVLVNLVELLCTAGLPAVFTRVLTLHELPTAQYYGYLVLYNLAYVFDDSLMVGVAVVTLGQRRLQESGGRWLKLLSGGVMGTLGLILLLNPSLLAG